MFSENYESLKLHLMKGNKFTFKRKNNLIPFTSNSDQRLNLDNGIMPIIGAFSRLVCNKKVKKSNNLNISDDILTNDQFEIEEGSEYYAKLLVKEYLGGDQLNILHPKLFLYLPLTEGPVAGGEIKIAQFFKDVLFKDIDLDNFFKVDTSKFNSNILINFIVSNLVELDDENSSSEFLMPFPLNNVVNVFKEDIEFLLNNHEEYLVKNFEKIMSFYLFFYVNQFTLKVSSNYVSDELEKTYFLLDWETVSKNRQSVKMGYKKISDYLDGLLVKIDGIEHVNMLLGQKNLLPAELIQYFNDLDEINKKEFIKYFKLWISYFCSELKLESDYTGDNFEELLQYYFNLIEKYFRKTDSSSFGRYHHNIDVIGKKYFLKRRGRYSYMFNMNQEMLILIASLCIKEDKIRITQLFKEFERRGLFFDRDSSDKIVELFNKLNLIDKRSDSGDIQYVKSIL